MSLYDPGPNDDAPLTFGKHKGKTPTEVAELDPQYIVWLYNETDTGVVSKELAEACEQDVREGESESALDDDRLQAVDHFMDRLQK